MSVDAILKEIESLSVAERAELKARLNAQFAEDTEPETSPELIRLLESRAAAATANPSANIPWDVVYEQSLKRGNV